MLKTKVRLTEHGSVMPSLPSMVAAAHEIKKHLDDVLLRGHVKDSAVNRVAASLCLSIAEQFSATLHLVEGGFSSHAPVMLRSMLEAHANLLNLVADAAFVDQIIYDNARADSRLFTEYASDPGLHRDVEAQEFFARLKATAEPLCKEFEAKGYRKLDVIQRFKKANISSAYVAYRVLCSFSHNQLTTLLARHAGNSELRYHNQAPNEITVGILEISVSILCEAVSTATNYMDLTDIEMQQVICEVNQIWSAVKDQTSSY